MIVISYSRGSPLSARETGNPAFHPRCSDSYVISQLFRDSEFSREPVCEMLSAPDCDSSACQTVQTTDIFPSGIKYEVYGVQTSGHGRRAAFLIAVSRVY